MSETGGAGSGGFTTEEGRSDESVDRLDDTKALIRRLRRIEGQARGLQKMLAEGRECEELVIQLAAMRVAINKVGMAIVGRYMARCLREDIAEGKPGHEGLQRAVGILMKLS